MLKVNSASNVLSPPPPSPYNTFINLNFVVNQSDISRTTISMSPYFIIKFKLSHRLRWYRPRDFGGLEISVTTGEFELRNSYMQCSYLNY